MSVKLHESPFQATQLAALLQAMHGAADAARTVTVKGFRAPLAIDDKASGSASDVFDPVTSADREAERVIRQHLTRLHPEIAFFGEESVTEPVAPYKGGAATWVVDPIDGTRAYITGIPVWGTLIALHDGEHVALGLLDQPIVGERYIGGPDGAYLLSHGTRRRLFARAERRLADASLCCTTPEMFEGDERARFERVSQGAQMTRFGGDCYAYAQLAAGHVDIVVESDLKPWDIQALIPIVTAAGGVISDWSGGSAVDGGQIVACGSAALHAEVLTRLST